MRVVGRSGQVMDLPNHRAQSLLRDGTVKPADEQAPEKPEGSEAAESKSKPRSPRKPKSEE